MTSAILIRKGGAAILLAVLFAMPSATLAQDCKAISDSLERLRCYDGIPPAAITPSTKPNTAPASNKGEGPAAASAPVENPIVSNAKNAIKKILRDPASARFQDVQVKTKAGQSAVCGQVNSRNSAGGMTGPKLFVYDGKYARVLVSSEGPDNGTRFDNSILGVVLGEGLASYDKYCK